MKNSLLLLRVLPLTGAVVLSAVAVSSRAQQFDEPPERTGWFVRADAAARFNLKANVKTLPLPAGGPRIYDNGDVLPDISGSASGMTWNWSYQSADQIRYDANGQPESIVYRRFDNVPTVSQEVDLTSPMLEGEVVAGYHFDDFYIGKRRARVGFEVGYGYFSGSQGLNFQASGVARRTIATYRLWGVVPPVAPYTGNFNGPGPLLDLNPDPTRSSATDFQATTTFEGTLETTFHNFRFGPSFGIDLTKRLGAQFSAGYDSLLAQATMRYLETSAYTPNPTTTYLKESKWRVGFYAEILLNYQLTKHIQLLVGGDYQNNSNLTFTDSRHEYTIELGSTYAVKGGLSYSF